MLGYPLQPVPGGWRAHAAGILAAILVDTAFAFSHGGKFPSMWGQLLVFIIVFFPIRAVAYRLIERRWLKRKIREMETAARHFDPPT